MPFDPNQAFDIEAEVAPEKEKNSVAPSGGFDPSRGFDIEDERGNVSRETSPDVSMGESLLRGGAQGATLGFGDELSAAFEFALGKTSDLFKEKDAKAYENVDYSTLRDENRAINKEAQEANPVAYGTGQAVGSIVTTAPLASGAGAANLIKTGATIGAVQGAGESNSDSVIEMAKDAGVGSLVGGSFSALVAGGGPVVKRAATKVTKGLDKLSTSLARRALGFTKGQLKKLKPTATASIDDAGNIVRTAGPKGPLAGLKEADKVARQIADQDAVPGIISPKNSFHDIAEKVIELQDISGKQIGAVLNEFDAADMKIFNADKVAQKLKADLQDIINEPVFKPLQKQTEAILATIEKRGSQNISFNEAQKLQNVLKKLAFKEGRELEGNEIAKKAWLNVRDAIEESVDKAAVSFGDKAKNAVFLEAKKNFGAASKAVRALEEKLSSTAGNRIVSLTDFVAGAGPFADPTGAAKAVIAKKIIESRGLQTGSAVAKGIADAIPKMGKYAAALQNAAARGGSSLSSTHYLMMEQDPEYNAQYKQATGAE